jgi:hypothetical protein
VAPARRGYAAYGWRYIDAGGGEQKRDAWIHDTPVLPGSGANSSQTFESTALAIEGEQVGTWYGSVRWGWRKDAAGTFARIPLSAVSTDVPSPTFREAASLWNTSTTSTGAATIDLPLISGRFITADNVDFISDPANPVATSLGRLAKNTRVEVTRLPGSGHAFNAGRAPADLWTKITVVDGVHIGKVGWVTRGFTGNRRVP